MKILLATGLYPPEIGGPATYARMLEQQLQHHNIALSVIPFGTVRHLPKFFRHIAFTYDLFKQAKDADVVYALDPVSVGVPAWLVSLIRHKPFLIRLGGDYAWEQGQQRFGLREDLDTYTANPRQAPLGVRVLASVQRFIVRRAKRVIVPSSYLKSIIATWGVREDRLRVIYSALFPLTVQQHKTSLRDQLSYTTPTIASVGRLVPWKGYSALIDAVAALRADGTEVTLVIIGDGPQQEVLQQKVEEMQVSEYVRLLGRMSKDALGAAIKAADVFVLNTAYEGLSHQLLEVMDLGVPVITTPVGGNPELIKHGSTGLLVPFNDTAALQEAITRMLSHPDSATRMTQTARARTKDFAQEEVVNQFVVLLQEEVLKKT